MPGYKYNYFNTNLIRSMNDALKQSLTENDQIDRTFVKTGKPVETTPEEVAQRAYFDTPRSSGDVSPENKQKFDVAYQTQLDKFNKLSPEAKQIASGSLWGDPNNKLYRTVPVKVNRVSFSNPDLLGLAVDRDIYMSDKISPSENLPHELAHIQKNATTPDDIEDSTRSYYKRREEAAAEANEKLINIRANKSPEKALDPLTPDEVKDALKNVKGAGYEGFESIPEKIRSEIEDYMRYKVVKKNQTNQGTALA